MIAWNKKIKNKINFYIKLEMSTSDLIFFNAADGYAEAFLRGFRKGILGENIYTAIKNSTNLKDLKSVSLMF